MRMAGNHQVINGSVNDIQLYHCCFDPEKRAQTRGEVLHPLSISLAGSTPIDQGLHLEVYISDVRLSVSPATIALLNAVYNTMLSEQAKQEIEKEEINHIDLWSSKQFDDDNFWFLKPEFGEEASSSDILLGAEVFALSPEQNTLKEICIINMPTILITVEAGVGNKTLPMIMLQSGFTGQVTNWSSQIGIEASLKLQMGYYNSHLALWEPLVEPVEIIKDKVSTYVPWELKFEMAVSEKDTDLSASSPVEEQPEAHATNTSITMDISSKTMLEVTLTKTCLEVLTNLGSAFASAIEEKQELKATVVTAPYVVVNELGIEVTLLLSKCSFSLCSESDPEEVVLQDQTKAPLNLKVGTTVTALHLTHTEDEKIANRFITVKVCDYLVIR